MNIFKITNNQPVAIATPSRCFEIIKDIEQNFEKLTALNYVANGIHAVFEYKDGNSYEVIVRPRSKRS